MGKLYSALINSIYIHNFSSFPDFHFLSCVFSNISTSLYFSWFLSTFQPPPHNFAHDYTLIFSTISICYFVLFIFFSLSAVSLYKAVMHYPLKTSYSASGPLHPPTMCFVILGSKGAAPLTVKQRHSILCYSAKSSICYIICNIIVLSGGFSQKLFKCKTMRNVIAAIEGVSRVSALHYCHSHCILLSRAAPIFCLKKYEM